MAEQRQRVVNELINTEKDYCNDLDLCVKYFLHELQTIQVGFLQHSVLRVHDLRLFFCLIFNFTRSRRKNSNSLQYKLEGGFENISVRGGGGGGRI